MSNIVPRYDTMSGSQKAAAFMLAVDPTQASSLLSMLELDELKDLSQTMSLIGRIDSEVVERLLEEFCQQMQHESGIMGGYRATERLLLQALDPERVASIMDEIRGPQGRTVWDKLGNVNEAVLGSYLRNEYPQTVAVILARLPPAHASRVISTFPDELALDVMRRIIALENVQKEVLADVERTLRNEFVSNLARTNRNDNHEMVAEIFNHFDRATESRLIEMLEQADPEAATQIRSLMFTFDDLIKIDDSGIQLLLRRAGNDRLKFALKGAKQEISDLFMRNIAERTAKMLREELAGMGPIRLREVEEAQQFLVNLAKELAASGEIVLLEESDEEMVI
ncbi:flagellar motor switch protein FliG [Arboricoccus pini]|uniref:Flagellar motor switch protein FliG n=1 Tax=Arboricoccus pini TaxID=1963835 RepID=A0A212RBJ2_9PROT|nr:flagellar motor switch protein FliG [Arboricoccus pini]SNB69582.1 flagellar motor switch protein FliG [Arboricoccus pini]